MAIFLFCVGLASAIKMQLVLGDLYATDLILCLALGLLMPTARRLLSDRAVRVLLIFWLLWIAGAVVTDLYRDTPWDRLLRGWSKIIFFGSDLAGVLLLCSWSMSRLRSLIFGWACSFLLIGLLSQDEIIRDNAGKFEFCYGISLIVTLVASSRPFIIRFGIFGQLTALIACATIDLFLNSRSMFLICACAAIFCALKFLTHRGGYGARRLSPALLGLVALVGICLTGAVEVIYADLASSGTLGAAAQTKYEDQAAGEFGVLLSGRSEILYSYLAVMQSPFIGHGAWAQDASLISRIGEIFAAYGVVRYAPANDASNTFYDDVISAHSHLLGSWVEAGIAGAAFWFMALFVVARAIYLLFKSASDVAPITCLLLFMAAWDILFSPFGGDHRWSTACEMAVALFTLHYGGELLGRAPTSITRAKPRRYPRELFRKQSDFQRLEG